MKDSEHLLIHPLPSVLLDLRNCQSVLFGVHMIAVRKESQCQYTKSLLLRQKLCTSHAFGDEKAACSLPWYKEYHPCSSFGNHRS